MTRTKEKYSPLKETKTANKTVKFLSSQINIFNMDIILCFRFVFVCLKKPREKDRNMKHY
jgi:hypothetical protein